jgi:hypothetical protein
MKNKLIISKAAASQLNEPSYKAVIRDMHLCFSILKLSLTLFGIIFYTGIIEFHLTVKWLQMMSLIFI